MVYTPLVGVSIYNCVSTATDMRRITLETDYGIFWKMIFGPNLDRVEIKEAIRSFRCDSAGFALILRIMFKEKNMTVKDLVGEHRIKFNVEHLPVKVKEIGARGALTNAEVLYKEKDGSLVMFIEGTWEILIPPNPKDAVRVKGFLREARQLKVIPTGPPEFIDKNRLKHSYIGEEKEIQRYLRVMENVASPTKILSLGPMEPHGESQLSRLSPKQRQALLTAYGLGYYDVPRRISSEDVARHLKVDKSTVVEHLRKAQKKILLGVMAH